MDEVIAKLVRLRNTFFPELAVLVALVVHTIASYKGLVDATPWLGQRAGVDLQLTAAGWYMPL